MYWSCQFRFQLWLNQNKNKDNQEFFDYYVNLVNSGNYINRIENIISEIDKNEFYKFDTFFSYHDALYNNRLYNNSEFSISNEVLIKELASNEWKKYSELHGGKRVKKQING